MFLLEECRDPHSGKWIEDFLGLQNLLNYHGTGAFDINRFATWDRVFLEMMEMPKGMLVLENELSLAVSFSNHFPSINNLPARPCENK